MPPTFQPPHPPRLRLRLLAALASALMSLNSLAGAVPADQSEFFENRIRPLLADKCFSCHSARAKSVKGNLRLDLKSGVAKGGDSGALLVPGKPEESLLVQSVLGKAKDLDRMPPKGDALSAVEIDALRHWITTGAADPREDIVTPRPQDSHWAFQRPVAPPIPVVTSGAPETGGPSLTPLDRLIRARLDKAGLHPSPAADRRTVLRRISFDLTGLPATPEETQAFLTDPSPGAYAAAVDRLLASPRYGERWGRHWLDVARYADSKGYVFEEERRYAYAYTYRDWVVRALNEDLPYDQFLIAQIAGDQVATPDNPWPMAAQGFLTLGRRFLNNNADIIDDRIDVICRGTMGLTVGCARCHDHKFDPIPTADYYSLYGILDSSQEPGEKPLLGPNPNAFLAAQYATEHKKRTDELAQYRADRTEEVLTTLRERIADYLRTAQESLPLDGGKAEALARTRSLDPGLAGAWKSRLSAWKSAGQPHRIFGPWVVLAEMAPTNTAAWVATHLEGAAVNPRIAASLRQHPPQSLEDLAHRYGEVFAAVQVAWTNRVVAARKASQPAPSALEDPADEELRQVLYGAGSPITEVVGGIDRFFATPVAQKTRALRRRIEELEATDPGAPLRAMALLDKSSPVEPVVFKRGNPGNHGPRVPRQFLEVVSGPKRKPFTRGSGRLELAQAIASRDNPLTARVLVNRVWALHFGSPLVRTPGDFGLRSDPPTHPEVLDHLAVWFMDHGWSLKELHRYLLLSATYQQTSDPGASPAGRKTYERNEATDPANQNWWRMNRKRADFEALRDSLLVASGALDATVGGQPVTVFEGAGTPRRTLYGFIDRQNLPGLLRAFDFASPDSTAAMRYQTTVPQQALFLMNSPFMAARAHEFVIQPAIATAANLSQKLERMHQIAFQRAPTAGELELARSFLERPTGAGTSTSLPPIEQYAQALLSANEFVFVD